MPAAQPALGGRADVDDGLAVELAGVADADRQERGPPAVSPGAARAEVKRLAGSSPNAARAAQLAAGPPVELAERAVEGGLADDRDDEDVGRDVPRLVGDDAKLPRALGPPERVRR